MHTLTERDLDEVDAMLVPAVHALRELRAYLDSLGVTPGQQCKVISERWPYARQALVEESWPSVVSAARH